MFAAPCADTASIPPLASTRLALLPSVPRCRRADTFLIYLHAAGRVERLKAARRACVCARACFLCFGMCSSLAVPQEGGVGLRGPVQPGPPSPNPNMADIHRSHPRSCYYPPGPLHRLPNPWYLLLRKLKIGQLIDFCEVKFVLLFPPSCPVFVDLALPPNK